MSLKFLELIDNFDTSVLCSINKSSSEFGCYGHCAKIQTMIKGFYIFSTFDLKTCENKSWLCFQLLESTSLGNIFDIFGVVLNEKEPVVISKHSITYIDRENEVWFVLNKVYKNKIHLITKYKKENNNENKEVRF